MIFSLNYFLKASSAPYITVTILNIETINDRKPDKNQPFKMIIKHPR
ncbi:hypothetical protein LP2241_10063 [Pseudolactococcus piscium]|nr:hypothetical protein LP2241_10063 [Lactococcus piscium]